MTNNNIKVYGKNVDNCTTEELKHRLGFLKRQNYSYMPSLEAKRREEAWAIESELFFRNEEA